MGWDGGKSHHCWDTSSSHNHVRWRLEGQARRRPNVQVGDFWTNLIRPPWAPDCLRKWRVPNLEHDTSTYRKSAVHWELCKGLLAEESSCNMRVLFIPLPGTYPAFLPSPNSLSCWGFPPKCWRDSDLLSFSKEAQVMSNEWISLPWNLESLQIHWAPFLVQLLAFFFPHYIQNYSVSWLIS